MEDPTTKRVFGLKNCPDCINADLDEQVCKTCGGTGEVEKDMDDVQDEIDNAKEAAWEASQDR